MRERLTIPSFDSNATRRLVCGYVGVLNVADAAKSCGVTTLNMSTGDKSVAKKNTGMSRD